TADTCSFYGVLYESVDGGHTWSTGSEVHGAGLGLEAVNPSTAFLTGAWASNSYVPWLLVTTDAGSTWTSIQLPLQLGPNMHGSREYEFVDAHVGFVLASTVAP